MANRGGQRGGASLPSMPLRPAHPDPISVVYVPPPRSFQDPASYARSAAPMGRFTQQMMEGEAEVMRRAEQEQVAAAREREMEMERQRREMEMAAAREMEMERQRERASQAERWQRSIAERQRISEGAGRAAEQLGLRSSLVGQPRQQQSQMTRELTALRTVTLAAPPPETVRSTAASIYSEYERGGAERVSQRRREMQATLSQLDAAMATPHGRVERQLQEETTRNATARRVLDMQRTQMGTGAPREVVAALDRNRATLETEARTLGELSQAQTRRAMASVGAIASVGAQVPLSRSPIPNTLLPPSSSIPLPPPPSSIPLPPPSSSITLSRPPSLSETRARVAAELDLHDRITRRLESIPDGSDEAETLRARRGGEARRGGTPWQSTMQPPQVTLPPPSSSPPSSSSPWASSGPPPPSSYPSSSPLPPSSPPLPPSSPPSYSPLLPSSAEEFAAQVEAEETQRTRQVAEQQERLASSQIESLNEQIATTATRIASRVSAEDEGPTDPNVVAAATHLVMHTTLQPEETKAVTEAIVQEKEEAEAEVKKGEQDDSPKGATPEQEPKGATAKTPSPSARHLTQTPSPSARHLTQQPSQQQPPQAAETEELPDNETSPSALFDGRAVIRERPVRNDMRSPPRDLAAVAAALNLSLPKLLKLRETNPDVRQLVDKLVALPVVRDLAAQEIARGGLGAKKRRVMIAKQLQESEAEQSEAATESEAEQSELEASEPEVSESSSIAEESEQTLVDMRRRLTEYEAMAAELKDVLPKDMARFLTVIEENVERMKVLRRRLGIMRLDNPNPEIIHLASQAKRIERAFQRIVVSKAASNRGARTRKADGGSARKSRSRKSRVGRSRS